MRQNPTSVC